MPTTSNQNEKSPSIPPRGTKLWDRLLGLLKTGNRLFALTKFPFICAIKIKYEIATKFERRQ